MGNYRLYFVLIGLCALGLVGIIFSAVAEQDSSVLMGVTGVLTPLGLLELTTGLWLYVRKRAYPDWVVRSLKVYWRLTGAYFALSFIGTYLMPGSDKVLIVWLLIVPWGIAIYQVNLVRRMAVLRKRQLQKRELLELS